jgi:hypothetical protein
MEKEEHRIKFASKMGPGTQLYDLYGGDVHHTITITEKDTLDLEHDFINILHEKVCEESGCLASHENTARVRLSSLKNKALKVKLVQNRTNNLYSEYNNQIRKIENEAEAAKVRAKNDLIRRNRHNKNLLNELY